MADPANYSALVVVVRGPTSPQRCARSPARERKGAMEPEYACCAGIYTSPQEQIKERCSGISSILLTLPRCGKATHECDASSQNVICYQADASHAQWGMLGGEVLCPMQAECFGRAGLSGGGAWEPVCARDLAAGFGPSAGHKRRGKGVGEGPGEANVPIDVSPAPTLRGLLPANIA
jgi:hypothetical protein